MAQGKKQGNSFKKRVKQIFEYDNSQNWTALRTTLADTMKMYLLSGAVIVKSPEALITFFKENRKEFPDEHLKEIKLSEYGSYPRSKTNRDF